MSTTEHNVKEAFEVQSLCDKAQIVNGESITYINPKENKLGISELWSILIRCCTPVPIETSPIKEDKQTDKLKNKILTSLSWKTFFNHAVTAARDCYDIYAPEFDVIVIAIQAFNTKASNFFKDVGEILGWSLALKVRDFSNENINEDTRERAPSEIDGKVQKFAHALSNIPFDAIKEDLLQLQSLSADDKKDLIKFIIENVQESIEYFLNVTEERFKDMTPLTIREKMIMAKP